MTRRRTWRASAALGALAAATLDAQAALAVSIDVGAAASAAPPPTAASSSAASTRRRAAAESSIALLQQRGRAGEAGVRDGAGPTDADRDALGFGDGTLDRNEWTGASQAYDFEFLDNLEPIAPMDGVSPSSSVASLGPGPLPAEQHNSLYIPPYKYPDAFPTVSGPVCTCETPALNPPTKVQKDWSKRVAKQLGIKLRDLPKPMSPYGMTTCTCPASDGKGAPEYFHWVNLEPVGTGRKFTMSPADITYSGGNYWQPKLRGGLAAPQDRMPMENYPLQASADSIQHFPATGREDRVASKFARYIDQVEARTKICEGDGVSEECTAKCRPGDGVVLAIGQTRVNAAILSTHTNGAVVVEYTPHTAQHASFAAPCPQEAACSVFRSCRHKGGWCVEHEGKKTRDYLGNLRLSLACPAETTACSTIQQVVAAKYLQKDGLNCVATGPKAMKLAPI